MRKQLALILVLMGVIFAAQNIEKCTTIDEAGKYVLISDLEYTGSANCIKILKSGVTIDCAGHRMTGSYAATGIRINNDVDRVTLQNCTIDYFKYGIYVEEDTRDTIIENIRIDSCDEGIVLRGGNDAEIISPVFTNTDIGLHLHTWHGGELSGGKFSTRDYGVYAVSSGGYTITQSEFTDSEYGVYTEGICEGLTISGNLFHRMGTPLDLRGSSSSALHNTFRENIGYALSIRGAMNTFDGVHIHSQENYIATQSSAFTILNLTIGKEGTPGSINFGSFALRKPHTSTKYYYYNSTNVKLEPGFIYILPPEYAVPEMKEATLWLLDEGFDFPVVMNSPAKKYTTQSTVLMEGQTLEAIGISAEGEVLSFTLAEFGGAYAIGEMPPEVQVSEVTSLSLEAPIEALVNSPIIVTAKDQDGNPLEGAAIYYYRDFSSALLAGYTSENGTIEITIAEGGAFIVQANFEGITSQRAIDVALPYAEPEPEAGEPEPEPAALPEAEPEPEDEGLSPLLAFLGGAVLLLFLAAVAGWLAFLGKPKKPQSRRNTIKDKLKKFRKG
jgi:hypothetical protein